MDSLSINTETGAGPVEQNQTTSGRSLAELEHIVEKGKATFSAMLEMVSGWSSSLTNSFTPADLKNEGSY